MRIIYDMDRKGSQEMDESSIDDVGVEQRREEQRSGQAAADDVEAEYVGL